MHKRLDQLPQTDMARYRVLFESKERLLGVVPKANDRIEYKCILRVKGGGKMPVSLDMEFVPPHPFLVNMPLKHSIKAKSITAAYGKVV